MRKAKYKFVCALNGREAVDRYRENPRSILLVLMDISMPVMDGFEATAKIRETERRQRLPRAHIAALTGVTSEEAKNQAFASGGMSLSASSVVCRSLIKFPVDDFYSKPVGMQEIKQLLSRLQDDEDPK